MTRDKLLVGLFVALFVAAWLGLAAGYGQVIYSDWKCGMPGVQCRLMKGGGR